jgi:hypothetical protein
MRVWFDITMLTFHVAIGAALVTRGQPGLAIINVLCATYHIIMLVRSRS